MAKTLKQLLDQVNGEIGFEIPDQYFGSTDPNITQLIAIANKCAVRLRDLRLQYLTRFAKIDLSGGTPALYDSRIRIYSMPGDFYALVPDTTYQTGRIDQAQIPTSPETWNYLISRSGPSGLRVRARFENDKLYVFSPENAQTLQFEYVSKYPIQSVPAGGVGFSPSAAAFVFGKDTDIWLLDDPLIELDIKWRYKKEKGLDWGSQDPPRGDYKEYTDYETQLRGRDSGARTIYWPFPSTFLPEPFTNLWVA